MGSISIYTCTACGADFRVADGGGFFFDRLHCDACGKSKSVTHRDLGDIHLRFVKGLRTPYALARAAMDRDIQANYPGEPITRAEYHALAEATLEPCACGGRFRYGAPARCPNCKSTSESWSGGKVVAHVD
ncbi:MAG: hypothetical protein U0838_06910 [Chloroflexota bacterium]